MKWWVGFKFRVGVVSLCKSLNLWHLTGGKKSYLLWVSTFAAVCSVDANK